MAGELSNLIEGGKRAFPDNGAGSDDKTCALCGQPASENPPEDANAGDDDSGTAADDIRKTNPALAAKLHNIPGSGM